MAQDTTLHIKIDSKTDKSLKKLAYEKGKSKGQLVREAITACYQASLEELPVRQAQALAAYQGGYISMGKLAEVMGMHVLDLRNWLNDHGIPQSTVFEPGDVDNA